MKKGREGGVGKKKGGMTGGREVRQKNTRVVSDKYGSKKEDRHMMV